VQELALAASRRCQLCSESFGALWVHRGVCYACESTVREEGRCPFATQKIAAGCGGLPHTFCSALPIARLAWLACLAWLAGWLAGCSDVFTELC
jgi:hypothetical protein